MILKDIILSIFICAALSASANIESAESSFNKFRSMTASKEADGLAYGVLSQAYNDYIEVFRNSPQGSDHWEKAKIALKDIFPYLRQGAYFYTRENDQAMVLRYAAAYIDLSLLPGMGDERLQESPGYPVLAHLAATNIFNRGDYQNAILYFQAYLSSGDTQYRELAFEGLARSYYELRNYDNAIYIASQGFKSFPTNWNLLLIGIEACGRAGNDNKMEPLLEGALKLQPDHKLLLDYKGKMLERMKRYDEAAEVYDILYGSNDTSLDYVCHLAFDNYNAGVSCYRINKNDPEAMRFFSAAIPLLDTIFANSPYAVNVANALAVCYSLTGDRDKLAHLNQTLTMLSVPQVANNALPELETRYMPTANLSPVIADQAIPNNELISDVDINIPVTSINRPDTYVVIIGNEDYKYFSDVDYAKRDATTFAEYCRKTLGIPEDNIKERYDATLSEIRESLKYLREKTKMNPEEIDIIMFYAGHGIPDVANGTAHLLPVDASGTDFDSCIELEKMYSMFDEMPAKSITVFLDACFSGATRSNEMLFKERFVEYEIEDVMAKGITVVFTATTGKQTAMAYDEQHHGFFTYFLLKSLQETKGNITLGELERKLIHDVDNKAYDIKNKHQTPTVKVSPNLGDSWKNRKI